MTVRNPLGEGWNPTPTLVEVAGLRRRVEELERRLALQNDDSALTIGIVMDRSGSMAGIWDKSVDATKAMLDENATDGETAFTLTVFDDRVETLGGGDIDKFSDMISEVRPFGMTALFDGVVAGINNTRSLAKTQKVLMVIVTDGLENASTISQKAVKEAVQKARDSGWEFMFIGANQDAWAAGHRMGVHRYSQWDGTGMGLQTSYNDTVAVARAYRTRDDAGVDSSAP